MTVDTNPIPRGHSRYTYVNYMDKIEDTTEGIAAFLLALLLSPPMEVKEVCARLALLDYEVSYLGSAVLSKISNELDHSIGHPKRFSENQMQENILLDQQTSKSYIKAHIKKSLIANAKTYEYGSDDGGYDTKIKRLARTIACYLISDSKTRDDLYNRTYYNRMYNHSLKERETRITADNLFVVTKLMSLLTDWFKTNVPPNTYRDAEIMKDGKIASVVDNLFSSLEGFSVTAQFSPTPQRANPPSGLQSFSLLSKLRLAVNIGSTQQYPRVSEEMQVPVDNSSAFFQLAATTSAANQVAPFISDPEYTFKA